MKGLVIALVAFVGIASATQHYVCPCPLIYAPVCASDGVTYPNQCSFECQRKQNSNLEIVNQGPCPQTQTAFVRPCPLIWAPICGSDGVTYSNKCFLEGKQQTNSDLKIVSNGPCPKREIEMLKPCICTKEYFPVCGSDGKTYSNKCTFQCAASQVNGLKMAYMGECRDVQVESVADPCLCTQEYNPVCGTDGHTYSNPCTLRCVQSNKNVMMAYMGECRKSCICTREYMPVCGSDGKTYTNMCMFNCATTQTPDLTIFHNGACKIETQAQALHPCMCTREYNPVCGTDGKTYGNPCTFRCAASQTNGLKMAYMGECRKPCICTREYMPVCGSDGKTYGNMCMLNCAASQNPGLKMINSGECMKNLKACVCTREYNPMCGTDGKTYNNMCLLNCAANETPELKMAYRGMCKSAETEAMANPCICTREYNPVCGTDGHTYSNPCTLRCVQQSTKGLKMAYMGECQAVTTQSMSDPCICTQEYNPVCGTDGHTYSNPCVLRCVQQSNKGLKMAYMGECQAVNTQSVSDPCICTQEYNPVCGTDGHTYSNPCVLRCVQQSNKDLLMAYMGECQMQVPARDVCVCTLEWAPVCGTDGKTYGNNCGLNCAAKTINGLKVAYPGECLEQIMASFEPICPAIWAPVCGSDGKTYGNMCQFNYEASQNPTLAKIHEGSC